MQGVEDRSGTAQELAHIPVNYQLLSAVNIILFPQNRFPSTL